MICSVASAQLWNASVDFMADAAHELDERRFATALHLQMGTRFARAADEAERAEAMGRLSAGVQRAIRLVEQLLSLGTSGTSVSKFTAYTGLRLDGLVSGRCWRVLVPLADARKIDLGDFSFTGQFDVLADPDALRTLVRNLVDNAVRYTPAEGSRVDLTVAEPWQLTHTGPVLRVVDSGPGIPPPTNVTAGV